MRFDEYLSTERGVQKFQRLAQRCVRAIWPRGHTPKAQQEALEIAFEVSSKLVFEERDFKSEDELIAFARTSLRNKAIDVIRRLSVRSRPRFDQLKSNLVEADYFRQPFEMACFHEFQERLNAAYKLLSNSEEEAIRLRVEGLSYSEAAELMGLSKNTYGTVLRRARRQLRIFLKASGGDKP